MLEVRDISTDTILDIYQRILRIRRFEEEVGRLFKNGQLPGLVHLYIGEEAVGAGVCAALRDDDYITSTHRGHGHVIAKGGDVNRMIEDAVAARSGHKSLYSDAYYDRETFDAVYGGEVYRVVKDKYDPGKRLTGLYEKAVGRR